jgi:hypothetical protein
MIDSAVQPDYTPLFVTLITLVAIGVFLLAIIAGMLAEAISLYRARRRKPVRRDDDTDRADWWRN